MSTNEVLLLKLIKVNGSLDVLLGRGLTGAQIGSMLIKLVKADLIVMDETGVFLSKEGEKELSDGLAKLKLEGKESWILPQKKYYKRPLSNDAIILPKKI